MSDAQVRRHGWRSRVALAFVLPFASASLALAQPASSPVTFTRDIAPIFQDRCESCHRPDSIAPMSLVTYADARPWARAIRARVAARQMPPWHIDKTVGIQEFKNDRSLTDDQIAAVLKWVDSGAPMGDPKEMPAPRQWPDEQVWTFAQQFGPPDLIVKSPVYTMPAHGQDIWFKPGICPNCFSSGAVIAEVMTSGLAPG